MQKMRSTAAESDVVVGLATDVDVPGYGEHTVISVARRIHEHDPFRIL